MTLCLVNVFGQSDGEETRITPMNFSGSVGKYKKLEVGLILPPTIGNEIDLFLNGQSKGGINPFDPAQINIEAIFTSVEDGKSHIIYGFYYREFRPERAELDTWKAQRTVYPWRIRFAPDALGEWTCSIRIKVPTLDIEMDFRDCVEITCVASDNPGYLEVGLDRRHLRFSDTRSSFFAIGQNIAWPIEIAENWETGRVSANSFVRYRKAVENLAKNSGNYFRLAMATWGHAIEWEELGNYQSRLSHAWELDKIFEISEANSVYVLLCLEMQNAYNASADGSRVSVWGWENNPYNSASQSNKNAYSGILHPAEVLSSKYARKYFKRRLRYIIARWGYSTSLGVVELLNELDHWDGFKHDMEMQGASVNWHRAMFDYIQDSLGHKQHLISTSYGGNPHNYRVNRGKELSHPFDFLPLTSAHKYSSAKGVGFRNFKMMQSCKNGMVRGNWKNKPTIMEELGMQASAPQTKLSSNRADPGDIEGCDDISFHNALWSSAFMGGYGAGLNWWQDHNDAHRKANYPQMAAFFKDVDFESVRFNKSRSWRDWHLNFNFKNKCEETGNLQNTREVFAQTSKDKTMAIGWAHNATYYWGNLKSMTTCKDRNKRTMERQCDDDKYAEPISIAGKKIKVKGLKPMKRYTLEWYQLGAYGLLSTEVKRTNLFGRLKPRYPSDSEPDLAFKVRLN